MTQTYPIVEIFHSVQGEVFHAGIPHVFVRFGNCNLRCEWCDTDFLTYEDREIDSIVDEVLSYNCDRVIFTGGEPAMQDLETIGSILKEHGINLSIETNGTILVDPIIDWIDSCRKGAGPCASGDLKAIAHITGGGLSNLLRLHDSLGWHISNPLPIPPEFNWMAETGKEITYETAQVALLEKKAALRLSQVVRDIMGMYALLDGNDKN